MDNIEKERICACALGRIFGFEPRYAVKFMEVLGSAASVFGLSPPELDGILGQGSRYRGRICKEELEKAAESLEKLSRDGVYFISSTEDDFPEALRACEDAPAGLYVKSRSSAAEVFNRGPAIAIVGTRDISPYGKEWTPRIVQAISQAPCKASIVSGLAFGVDIRSHLAALDCGLPTIAVLPTGMDMIYPAAHRTAAERIAESKGSALISDYPPGTSPVAHTFLRRNRIIAGMCGTTILVESKIHGGGLITCRLASGYGRNVLALPGRIDDLRSAGCNLLLQEKVAEPLSDLRLLGEQLGLGTYRLRRKADFTARVKDCYSSSVSPDTLEELCTVADMIHGNRGISLDELCSMSGMGYARIAELTNILESDRLIDVDLLQRCTINIKNA